MFDLWKGTDALDSPLEKNEELKSLLLLETRVAQDWLDQWWWLTPRPGAALRLGGAFVRDFVALGRPLLRGEKRAHVARRGGARLGAVRVGRARGGAAALAWSSVSMNTRLGRASAAAVIGSSPGPSLSTLLQTRNNPRLEPLVPLSFALTNGSTLLPSTRSPGKTGSRPGLNTAWVPSPSETLSPSRVPGRRLESRTAALTV